MQTLPLRRAPHHVTPALTGAIRDRRRAGALAASVGVVVPIVAISVALSGCGTWASGPGTGEGRGGSTGYDGVGDPSRDHDDGIRPVRSSDDADRNSSPPPRRGTGPGVRPADEQPDAARDDGAGQGRDGDDRAGEGRGGTRGVRPAGSAGDGPSASATTAAPVAIASERVYTSGPWTKTFVVRDTRESARSRANRPPKAFERRTATAPDALGAWTIAIERRESAEDAWTLERTLSLARSSDGRVTLSRLDDASRGTRTVFEPALVLVPRTLSEGRHEHESKATTSEIGEEGGGGGEGDVGKATAWAEVLEPAEDGAPRARLVLRLAQGSSVVTRTADLTLGEVGAVGERTQRVVEWNGFAVDRADERLTLEDGVDGGR